MTTTRRSRAPRDHVIAGIWPVASLDGDPAAEVAQFIAARLREELGRTGYSLNGLRRRAGVNRQTITNILEGRVWVTIAVIADLESALGATLWPMRSFTRAGQTGHAASSPGPSSAPPSHGR